MDKQVISNSVLDDKLVSVVQSTFRESSFSGTVQTQYYSVMLSLPADSGPNSFQVLAPNGSVLLHRLLNHTLGTIYPYVAYSPAGSVKVNIYI